MKIDLKKKYRTRDGYEVAGLRASYSDIASEYAFIGTILEKSGEPMSEETWTEDGRYMRFASEPCDFDLVEVEESLPTMLDLTKQYMTRKEGRLVHNLRLSGIEDTNYPLIGNIEGNGVESVWTLEGRFMSDKESSFDLILADIPTPSPAKQVSRILLDE